MPRVTRDPPELAYDSLAELPRRRLFFLPSATVEFHRHGARTTFSDGTVLDAVPEGNDTYYARAAKLGYGTDTLAMCQEHELLHSVLAELLLGGPSPALWRAAQGDYDKRGLGQEEAAVLEVQRAWRASAWVQEAVKKV